MVPLHIGLCGVYCSCMYTELMMLHFLLSLPQSSSSGPARDAAAHVLELKLKALILDTVHNIDVVQMLQRDNIRSTGHWLWQKQLRCYLSKGW